MLITVEKVLQKENKKGKKFQSVKIVNGDWANYFSVNPQIIEGNSYEVEIETNGDFKNIKTLEPAAMRKVVEKTNDHDKQKLIVRQNQTSAAVDLVCKFAPEKTSLKKAVKVVMDVRKILEDDIYHDLELPF